jgi:hypothetical protein
LSLADRTLEGWTRCKTGGVIADHWLEPIFPFKEPRKTDRIAAGDVRRVKTSPATYEARLSGLSRAADLRTNMLMAKRAPQFCF